MLAARALASLSVLQLLIALIVIAVTLVPLIGGQLGASAGALTWNLLGPHRLQRRQRRMVVVPVCGTAVAQGPGFPVQRCSPRRRSRWSSA